MVQLAWVDQAEVTGTLKAPVQMTQPVKKAAAVAAPKAPAKEKKLKK
jgi:hypothetical protein